MKFTDDEMAALRLAHTQAKAYRELGRPAPAPVTLLERLYQQWRKQVQREQELQARRRVALSEALDGFDCDGWRHAA